VRWHALRAVDGKRAARARAVIEGLRDKLTAVIVNGEVARLMAAEDPVRRRLTALLDAAWAASRLLASLPVAAARPLVRRVARKRRVGMPRPAAARPRR
jgi:hypothetical protein